MEQGNICIYAGDGNGSTLAALGRALQTAGRGKQVVLIRFMKGRELEEGEFLRRLEPEIRLFCFEKSEDDFDALTPQQQTEEIQNIRNGLNYARKVLHTGECDMLVLDGIIGLVDNGAITGEEIASLLHEKGETVTIVMTGGSLPYAVRVLADEVVTVAMRA